MDETEPEPRVARVPPPVPSDVQHVYETRVLPAIVALVRDWWGAYTDDDRELWRVSVSATDGSVFVAAPDDDAQDAICCPADLSDATLLIGWQRYSNPAIRDPKSALAERLIALLLASDELAPYVEIEDMDDIAEDLGLYQRARGFVSEEDEERARESREDAEELEMLQQKEQLQQQEQDEEAETRRRRREEVRYGGATALKDSKTGGKNVVQATIEVDCGEQAEEDSPPAKVKTEPVEVDTGGENLASGGVERNFGRD